MLEEARLKTQEALAVDPTWSMTNTIQAQLDFMESCVANGRSPTPEEASRISLGVIAVRNLDDSYPEYSSLLKKLSYALSGGTNFLKTEAGEPSAIELYRFMKIGASHGCCLPEFNSRTDFFGMLNDAIQRTRDWLSKDAGDDTIISIL